VAAPRPHLSRRRHRTPLPRSPSNLPHVVLVDPGQDLAPVVDLVALVVVHRLVVVVAVDPRRAWVGPVRLPWPPASRMRRSRPAAKGVPPLTLIRSVVRLSCESTTLMRRTRRWECQTQRRSVRCATTT
jgi:hypothetical protein